MRQVLNGRGADVTATVFAAIRSARQMYVADLYLIGEEKDPNAIWITDWESPLVWPVYGRFNPGVVSRNKIESKIGLDAGKADIVWSPKRGQSFTNIANSTSPLQLAMNGFYDNWRVRIWRTYMPTPGDAFTWGAASVFGGFVSEVDTDYVKISMSANDYRYALNYKVPSNVIEVTNSITNFVGAKPPKGFTTIPYFGVVEPSSPNIILGDTLPINGHTAHHTFNNHDFNNPMSWLVFQPGPGSTLNGFAAPIAQNLVVNSGGTNYNEFILYTPLPWAPTPFIAGSGDTFFVSAAPTMSQADATAFGDPYDGFPYVPAPQTAI